MPGGVAGDAKAQPSRPYADQITAMFGENFLDLARRDGADNSGLFPLVNGGEWRGRMRLIRASGHLQASGPTGHRVDMAGVNGVRPLLRTD